jgi:predicted RNA-binding Zn-ribbon protein involved in translation (DUF1610 family)
LKVCPVCGSKRIMKISPLSGWLTPEEWFCPDCGYRGPIYGELEEKSSTDEE